MNESSSMLPKFFFIKKEINSICSKSPFLCLDYPLIILCSFKFFNCARLYPFFRIPQENRLLETLKHVWEDNIITFVK